MRVRLTTAYNIPLGRIDVFMNRCEHPIGIHTPLTSQRVDRVVVTPVIRGASGKPESRTLLRHLLLQALDAVET